MARGDLLQVASEFSNLTSPFDIPYGSNVVAGSLLLAYTSSSTGKVPVATDTQGNIWRTATFYDDVANNTRWDMLYAIAGASAACTVTLDKTPTGGSTVTYIFEYEGSFTEWKLADVASAQGVSTASATGDMTPTQNGSFFVAGHLLGADGTEAGGWTNDVDELGGGVAFLIFSHTVQAVAADDSGEASLASAYWINAGAVFSLVERISLLQFGIGV